MAKLPIDLSGQRGLVQNFSQATHSNYTGGNGFITGGIFNPFVRNGYMSPSSDTTTTVTYDNTPTTITATLYDPSGDDFYFLDDSNQVFIGGTLTDTSLTRSVNTGGSGTDLGDYIVYGSRKMFVAYNDGAGDMEIAISDFPYNSATDDVTWLTTTVSGAFTNALGTGHDAFFIKADNGFMYLLMKNQIHKIDGTTDGGANGTITPNVVVFPNNFTIVDGVDYRGSIYAAIHQDTRTIRSTTGTLAAKGSDVGVVIWNRTSAVTALDDYIPIPDAIAIHNLYLSPNATLRAIVTTSTGMVEIKEFTGTSFRTIQQISYGENPVKRGSVQVLGRMTYIASKLGSIYAHGSLAPGKPEGLFKLYDEATHTANSSSILFPIAGTLTAPPAVYFDYLTAGSARVTKRLSVHTLIGQLTGTADVGTVSTPVFDLPPMSTVRHIDIYTYLVSGTASTEMGTVKVYFNNSTTAFKTFSVTQLLLSRNYFRIELNKPFVNSIRLEIDFETTETLGTGNDFCPSIAMVDYDVTETKG